MVHDTEVRKNIRNWHVRYHIEDDGRVHVWTFSDDVVADEEESFRVDSNPNEQLDVALDYLVPEAIGKMTESLQKVDPTLEDGALQVPLTTTPDDSSQYRA